MASRNAQHESPEFGFTLWLLVVRAEALRTKMLQQQRLQQELVHIQRDRNLGVVSFGDRGLWLLDDDLDYNKLQLLAKRLAKLCLYARSVAQVHHCKEVWNRPDEVPSSVSAQQTHEQFASTLKEEFVRKVAVAMDLVLPERPLEHDPFHAFQSILSILDWLLSIHSCFSL